MSHKAAWRVVREPVRRRGCRMGSHHPVWISSGCKLLAGPSGAVSAVGTAALNDVLVELLAWSRGKGSILFKHVLVRQGELFG